MSRNVKSPAAALSRTYKPTLSKDGLKNLVSGMGTERDKRAHSFYGTVQPLTYFEVGNMYRDSWLAKRIVNSVAEDMTREWLTVSFDDNTPDSRSAIEDFEKKFSVKQKITDAMRWARLYGGCLVIIGIGNDNLKTPLDVSKIKKGDLRYLHVIDRWRASSGPTLTTDLDSPNFGLPDYYMLAESSVTVHHTRVLRFNGQKLPFFLWQQNARWDDSELQSVYTTIADNDAIIAAIATMMFEANVDVISSPDLATSLSTDEGTASLRERYMLAALMKSNNRMLLLDGQEKFEKKSNSFANLDKVVEKFMLQVCGASGIPATVLFGQSPSGMSATGESDTRNYYDGISAKQEVIRSPIEYLYEIGARSELGYMPENFDLEFNPLWQVTDAEEGLVEYQRAQTDQIYLQAGVVTEGIVARELKERGVYPNMTDDEIQAVEDLANEPPAPIGMPGLPGQPGMPPGPPIPIAPTNQPVKIAAPTPNQPVAGVSQDD